MADTKEQFEKVISQCRELFEKKLKDYGPSWRIMRPQSLTDQIFIKANRIRSLEIKGVSMVDEGIRPEFVAIVNYGVIGLIQLAKGFADTTDISNEEALALYDKYITATKELMYAKNHDYGEAWRGMRISSYTGSDPDETLSYEADREPRRQDDRVRRHRCQLYGHDQLCVIRPNQAGVRRRNS